MPEQPDRLKSLDRRLADLGRRVERLEKRVGQMGRGGGGGQVVTCSVCGGKVRRGENCPKCGTYVGR